MARINLEGLRVRDIRYGPGFQFQSEQSTQADNFVLDINSPPVIFLSPGGAIDILMPDSTAARRGIIFIFVNLSGSVVTLKTSADAAFATAVTVAANAATRVICTGNTTLNLGWVIW